MDRIICIMQARLGSTRLPGKVMKKLCDKTVLEHEINRLKLVNNFTDIVIATTNKKNDDDIVKECVRLGINYFRGDEKNVLSRYYECAMKNDADIVVRVTSDCPLMDSKIIDDVISKFLKYRENKNIDYLSNTIERTFPKGYDVEVFTFEALERAYKNAKTDYDKEHVTPYIYNKENKFSIYMYKNSEDYSKYRVTLDTKEDFKVITKIYDNLYKKNCNFGFKEVIEFIKGN